MANLTRRDFTALAASAAFAPSAAASQTWDAGVIKHILPTASARAILLKVSFREPMQAPTLLVSGRRFEGEMTDTEGRYWRFLADDLTPNSIHRLELVQRRRRLCEAWTLRTFPDANADISSFRLLKFTCAGGLEGARSIGGIEAFRPLAIRQRLLERALSFAPDAVIANGDHIYWDQHAWLEHANAEIRRLTRETYDRFGYFDRTQLIFGTDNEALIKRLAAPQIADLYETRLRSVPCFFIGDDHDYFENDDASPDFVAFPPDDFNIHAARAVQRLYYPEFLPEPTRPRRLPGASAGDTGPGISECFGTLRVGSLLEANLYDCGRYLSLSGSAAGLVPPDTEDWLRARTMAEDTRHYLHIPSHPAGWTAGKWREWYPDVLASEGGGDVVVSTHGTNVSGRLTTEQAKYLWQPGWFAQHQRLLGALSSQRTRAAAMISGDLHAIGHGLITSSGDLDLTRNPVHTILAGPLGSSTAGWPSFARGTQPQPPHSVRVDQDYVPQEKNGFTIIDVDRDRMTVRLFAWREPDSVELIDRLEPFDTFTIERPS
jgi:hypothetical protein